MSEHILLNPNSYKNICRILKQIKGMVYLNSVSELAMILDSLHKKTLSRTFFIQKNIHID